MNLPLAGLPLRALRISLFGDTRRVPGVGEGDGEGDGDGDGDGEGDGDGWPGADDRGEPGGELFPAVGPSAADAGAPGPLEALDAGVGLRLGEGRPPGGLDAALGVAKSPPPSATVEAWAGCVPPPAISSVVIPATTTAAATAATPAAARGRRRTSYHHRGPGGMTDFGKPVRPNGPARCVTLAR